MDLEKEGSKGLGFMSFYDLAGKLGKKLRSSVWISLK
jgi:hypothetical protein